ncbi:MAG: hypothetical protein Q8P03_01830 [bacterium]|nr:hypothetical protein [bacterium]
MNIVAELEVLVKKHLNKVVWGIVALLIISASFAAGYLTAREQLKEPIRIETNGQR